MLLKQILRLYNDSGSILSFCFKDVHIFKDKQHFSNKKNTGGEKITTFKGVQSPPPKELRYRKNIAIISQECKGNVQAIHPRERNNVQGFSYTVLFKSKKKNYNYNATETNGMV